MSVDLFEKHVRLVGTLESTRFQNDEGTWTVATVMSNRGRVTVVGNLLGATPGERLQLTGQWENNPKFGRQYRVNEAVVLPPTTRDGIVRYLSSGLIDGIGPVLAERLVDAFGEQTLDVLETQRDRLREVPGIGAIRQERILEAWDRQRAVRQVMLFLSSHSVSATYAHRIYQVYGDEAVEVVRKYPYRLARDVFGIGFKSADRIAQSVGLSPEDPERIIAGLTWTLDEGAGQGHVFLPRPLLIEQAQSVLEVPIELIEECLERAVLEGSLVDEKVGDTLERVIYSRTSHSIETELAKRFFRLAQQELRVLNRGALQKRIPEIERRMGVCLEGGQRAAIEQLMGRGMAVLTGGPGTGKTTIVRVFSDAVAKEGGRVLLAAPTGRAARRLSEATRRQAETIHRLLQFSFTERKFLRDQDNPLVADLVIVDEGSMLDQRLARALLRGLPPGCALLIVGDADQLPSVGPGNVLHDLLTVREISSARLTEVFRQAEQSDIVRNAHRIRVGELPKNTAGKPGGRGEFFRIATDDPERGMQRVVELVCDRIPKAFGWHPVTDVQVLSPMHRGVCGIQALNEALQAKLNPKGLVIHQGEREFRVGDKVIQLRNDYQREVFNGQIGQIEGLERESGEVRVLFGDRRVRYRPQDLFALALAYCISIHKSQGSEYPAVVAPIMNQHYVMLQRNLLYTAVTRAKELVCLVGQPQALRRAVGNAQPMRRFTALGERIRQLL